MEISKGERKSETSGILTVSAAGARILLKEALLSGKKKLYILGL